MAIWAFIVGIVAFFTGFIPVLGFILGASAVVFGVLALAKRQHKGFSIVGLSLGALAALISMAMTIAMSLGSDGLRAFAERERAVVPVPELQGKPGDEAVNALEDLRLTAELEDGTGNDRSVFSPRNWVVWQSDPEPNAEVEIGTSVTLYLVKPSDIEAAEDSAVKEAEQQEQFALDAVDLGEGQLSVDVRFEIADNLTRGMITRGAQRDTVEALRTAVAEYPEATIVYVYGSFPTTDQYGNEDVSDLLRLSYTRETIDEINFENIDSANIWAIRDGGMVHPDFEE